MAVPLLSPARSALRLDSLHQQQQHHHHQEEEIERLAVGVPIHGAGSSTSRSSSRESNRRTMTQDNYVNGGAGGITPPRSNSTGSGNGSASGGGMTTLGGGEGAAALMERQRSASRISLRPSYETLSIPSGAAGAAVPVAAIGKVNVTDPWGTAWGMDSPYDASVAYASNPNRLTMRQSAYFGSELTLAALAGPPSSSSHPQGYNHPSSNMASTSSGTLHPHPSQNAASPAPSSFSSISGSHSASSYGGGGYPGSGNGSNNVWSEVSSVSSSSFNGVLPPSAPWVNDIGAGAGKRRSVSFQGDLSQFNSNGLPSPTYSNSSDGHASHPHHPHQQHPAHHPQMPTLRARSTTHLPALAKSQYRHSAAPGSLPINRRTTSTPGTDADRSAFRKSFIGGSVVNQSGASASLPPVPVDPKVLAKQSKKSNSNLSASFNKAATGGAGGGGGNASSRASIMSSSTDKTDALSTLSGSEAGGGKKNKRKSWFARSPSSLSTAVETLSSTTTSTSISTAPTSAASSNMGRNSSRRSTDSLSATSNGSHHHNHNRPPALSRASSSFNNYNGTPPPPTPPIPDTLPLPPSLGDRSRKSSAASLRNRVNAQGNISPGAISPSPSNFADMLPPPPPPPSTASNNPAPNNTSTTSNNVIANVPPPATPYASRSKNPATPSVYGTPLGSPTNGSTTGTTQSNGNTTTFGGPTSSSPRSMSPMTSPTSAASIPLKPAASARPSALQLATHEEHSMQPDSFPSSSSDIDDRPTEEIIYMPAQPVTMSLPPTPITESGPGGPDRNALAPAAVIRPSPSSPPALGSLAALAGGETERNARMQSSPTTQTPMSTTGAGRQRISPAQQGRNSSRPTSPIVDQQQQISNLQARDASLPRSSSKGSLAARSAASMSPAASRKASNNSLRATVRQAPPSPEPSSAIVEHMSTTSPDQFLPGGPPDIPFRAAPPPPSRSPVTSPAAEVVENLAAPPHQPTLNMSLSSFAPRKAFPDHRNLGNNSNNNNNVAPLPRKSSAQSILPETVPLPDSPALPQEGFGYPSSQMTDSNLPLQPRGLVPQAQNESFAEKNASAKQLKPRASSPNLQSQNGGQGKAASSKPAQNGLPFPSAKGPGTPARKSSKSPFSLFKRSRSKTLGDGSPSPSEIAAAQLHAPPPPMPPRKDSFPMDSALSVNGSPLQQSTVQMTPAPTPQLSFSSSTTSTIAGSEPSDQFYADFAPDSRPTFAQSSSSSSGNVTINPNTKDAVLKKSSHSSNSNLHNQHHHQQQQHQGKTPISASKPQSGNSAGKGAFSRMFGASTKRKA